MQEQTWNFREEFGRIDVSGFTVEAVDGKVGKVDEAALEPGESYLVVDTGPPLVGKKVLLPAGLVSGIDRDEEVVYLVCTEDEIKKAPEFDRDRRRDAAYREQVAGYYAAGPGLSGDGSAAERGGEGAAEGDMPRKTTS